MPVEDSHTGTNRPAPSDAAKAQLKARVLALENIEREIDRLRTLKTEIYEELRAMGFNKKIVRRAILTRATKPEKLSENQALFKLYMDIMSDQPVPEVDDGLGD